MKYQKHISRIKKIVNLLFISLIFTFSFLIFISHATVSAQELTPAPSATPKVIDYQLAYPGLLPDHSLYFLKAMRDRVASFFISDPVKKAEFNLLQADKRVEASNRLLQKGNDKLELAQSTFSKAENYYEDGLNRVNDAKTQGINVSDLVKKFSDANYKHQEVLIDMQKKLTGKDKNKFDAEHGRLLDFEKRVKELLP